MNRRAFLAALIAGAVMDPERLLWIPGRKKIFIPPPAHLAAYVFGVASIEYEAAFMRYVHRVQADVDLLTSMRWEVITREW